LVLLLITLNTIHDGCPSPCRILSSLNFQKQVFRNLGLEKARLTEDSVAGLALDGGD
jgi:hypothetical protein